MLAHMSEKFGTVGTHDTNTRISRPNGTHGTTDRNPQAKTPVGYFTDKSHKSHSSKPHSTPCQQLSLCTFAITPIIRPNETTKKIQQPMAIKQRTPTDRSVAQADAGVIRISIYSKTLKINRLRVLFSE